MEDFSLHELGDFIQSLTNTLSFAVQNNILLPTTVQRVDDLLNIFLDKAEVCLNKMELCDDSQEENPDPNPNPEPLVFLGFSLNIYGAGAESVEAGHTDGLTFKVDVDGVVYTVIGSLTMTPIDMHLAMKALLTATTQDFVLVDMYENGSTTNYGYVLNAKSPTLAFLNKKVIVSVEKAETSPAYYGNITVQGVLSPADPNDIMQQVGITPGIGYFVKPN